MTVFLTAVGHVTAFELARCCHTYRTETKTLHTETLYNRHAIGIESTQQTYRKELVVISTEYQHIVVATTKNINIYKK